MLKQTFQPFTFYYHLHELRRNTRLKPPELIKLQNNRLRAILRHAYGNVQFYHQIFRSVGIKPEDIKRREDLSKLPIITKVDFQKEPPEKTVARNVRVEECIRKRTAGSSGMPLTVVFDSKAMNYRFALDTRPYLEDGLRLMDKIVVIQATPPPRFWFQKLGIWRHRHIPASDRFERHVHMLKEYRPDVIRGCFNSILLLAKMTHGVEEIRPRLVFTLSELSDKPGRGYVGQVFDADVYDLYGCMEFGNLAWECCERAGHHLSMDSVVVEFLRDGEVAGPGERGEVVVTNLYNYAQPLIRYNLKDVGIASDDQCSCGRGLPLMKIIEGRSDEMITAHDGRIVSPVAIRTAIRDTPGIAQFRVVQEKRDVIAIQIVKGEDFLPNTIREVSSKIKSILGEGTRTRIEIVGQIAVERSGKLRSVISKVPISW